MITQYMNKIVSASKQLKFLLNNSNILFALAATIEMCLDHFRPQEKEHMFFFQISLLQDLYIQPVVHFEQPIFIDSHLYSLNLNNYLLLLL